MRTDEHAAPWISSHVADVRGEIGLHLIGRKDSSWHGLGYTPQIGLVLGLLFVAKRKCPLWHKGHLFEWWRMWHVRHKLYLSNLSSFSSIASRMRSAMAS